MRLGTTASPAHAAPGCALGPRCGTRCTGREAGAVGGSRPVCSRAMADRRSIRDVAAARRGNTSGRMAGIERALAEERADSLGRAGDRLEDAIDTWHLLVDVGHATEEQVHAALLEIRDAAWALMVQRECVGFRGDNLAEIHKHYRIPAAALARI